jgi:hypothetical protein
VKRFLLGEKTRNNAAIMNQTERVREAKRKGGKAASWSNQDAAQGLDGSFELEHKLQSELHLPRRAGIASRKARIGDRAEGLASRNCDAARLSKIRVVEDVKQLGPELQAGSLGQLGVFQNREVRVGESGSG